MDLTDAGKTGLGQIVAQVVGPVRHAGTGLPGRPGAYCEPRAATLTAIAIGSSRWCRRDPPLFSRSI